MVVMIVVMKGVVGVVLCVGGNEIRVRGNEGTILRMKGRCGGRRGYKKERKWEGNRGTGRGKEIREKRKGKDSMG